MIQAGKLRHKVDIEQPVTSGGQDSYGAPTTTFEAYLSGVWTSIEPLQGRELMVAQEKFTKVTTRIRMRYQAGITSKMRVKYGTRYFNIEHVLNINERDRELWLMCFEIVEDNG